MLVTKGELLFEFEFDNVHGCRHLPNVGDLRVAAVERVVSAELCGSGVDRYGDIVHRTLFVVEHGERNDPWLENGLLWDH